MQLANPIYLLLIIVLILVYFWLKKKLITPAITYSDTANLKSMTSDKLKFITYLPLFIRFLALFVIIIALIQPQGVQVFKEKEAKGLDIILALDTSGSMNAEDFKPDNRLEVAKNVVKDFIKKRENDRIGLVVFGSDAYTQCPLTFDYNILVDFLSKVQIGMADTGTAIGMAIAVSLNRLKNSEAKSKIIILLTDGENNTGEIGPKSAAELAKNLGVKIYTIGVGKEGGAGIPIDDPITGQRYYARDQFGRLIRTSIDEDVLKEIAAITNANYYRAFDPLSLKNIYKTIDNLEKSKIKAKKHYLYTEYFYPYIWLAFFLLIIEILLQLLIVRIP
ncbi:VWA domain-containing protein [Candidatus Margulisiibacteriota bacterium]